MQDDTQQTLARDLGIMNLSLEEQDEVLTGFATVALKAATLSLLEKLTAEKQDEFARLVDADDPSAVKAFLDANVPNHEAIAQAVVVDEVRRFREYQQSAA